jgi:hypothetical protein
VPDRAWTAAEILDVVRRRRRGALVTATLRIIEALIEEEAERR